MEAGPHQSDRYAIARWQAEFVDPRLEAAFSARTFPETLRQWRIALWVYGSFFILFGISDLSVLGVASSTELLVLFSIRIVTGGMLIAAAIALRYRPDLAGGGYALAGLQVGAWVGFLALHFFLPPSSLGPMLAMSMVMSMGVFVFMPNRVVLSTWVGVFMIVSVVVVLSVLAPEPLAPLVLMVLLLVLAAPALSGLIVARRFQVVRRDQFASLLRAEAANEELAREIAMRRQLESELSRQAMTDPLTGLCNRRQYELLFGRELRRIRRHGGTLSLAVLDVDHFKRINDTYGHNSGDVALCLFADLCRSELRDIDVVGRLGGEEFLVILVDTPLEGALRVVDRLRDRLEHTEVNAYGATFRLTVTAGVTELCDQDRDIKDLIQRADAALYEGKRHGRNRVEVAA